MDGKTIALWTIAVVAIGIFALPSTVSLFAGQHVWYDLTDWSERHTTVPCEKCHADIADEMASHTGPHTELKGSWSGGSFTGLYCEDCHRVFYDYSGTTQGQNPAWPKYTYAIGLGTGSTPGKEAHAASTVECMDCHGVVGDLDSSWNTQHATAGNDYAYLQPCERCHAGNNFNIVFAAGGFNLTKGKSSWTWDYDPATDDTGEKAAHMKFVLDAMDDDTMRGANEACLACHTMIAVKINWTHRRSLEFDVGLDSPVTTDAGVHNWTLSNWSVNGTVNATVWGNTTGAGSTNYNSEWPGGVNGIYS